MLNPLQWIENKVLPVPHANELAGLTLKEAERVLRDLHGFSKSQATRFVARYKHRIGLARFRDEDGRAIE